ncbi:glycosyltransferase [Haloferula sp.]|uniref:glycosyltransferase n=1 Tax=Haloferula sp. TaxID=2497595 RepID=UPI003C767C8A
MRIEIVTDTFAPDVNGVAMTLGRLADGMRRRGHRVHVIRTGEERSPSETLAPSLSLPGYREIRLGLPGPFKLRKRWVKSRPDVIYVATESLLGVSAIKAASALRIPVVAGFHTNFHQYMEAYRLGGLQPAAISYLKHVHNRADLTLAPTPDVVEMLKSKGFENVRILGRGVDTELFHPGQRAAALRASWGVREGAPVAMVVGRLAAEKNLPLVMECFRRMRERVPDLQCVCVGDGPLRDSLKAKHPFVQFVGVKTGKELAAHYASADILLFPSESETFGNVILEGMASGLVTVSYDYAAAGRHVQQGMNGLKASKGNSSEFAELAMIALREWEGGMREEARRSVQGLGWESVILSFEESLAAAVRKRGRVTLSRKEMRKGKKRRFRSVFLSDIHLGTPESKVHEVMNFLKHIECEKLVLNGDIIDGWALRRGAKWRKRHSRFVRTILKIMERGDTEVVYCRGNHDDILERFLPLSFGKLRFVKENLHEAADGKKYLVIHGDGFDSVSTNHRWLATIGAFGYDSLLAVNRVYNHYRAWRGKEYFSLSKRVKGAVKSAVSFVDSYEKQLQALAVKRNCDGIICGHIHTPEDKQVGGVRYLNSGDWVESLTAIVEHHDGRMELIQYDEFMRELTDGIVDLLAKRKVSDEAEVILSA